MIENRIRFSNIVFYLFRNNKFIDNELNDENYFYDILFNKKLYYFFVSGKHKSLVIIMITRLLHFSD